MSDYKNSEVYQILSSPLLTLQRMKVLLDTADPRIISEMVTAEPDTVFLLDYYFRLFPDETAGRILNDPGISLNVLREFYNCQVIRFYRQKLEPGMHPETYDSLSETYWKSVNRERLLHLLTDRIGSESDIRESAVYILQELSSEELEILSESGPETSARLLSVFRQLGEGAMDVITRNTDLFDFLQILSAELEDHEYIDFLNRMTRFIVQLRIAEGLVEDSKSRTGNEGRITLKDLVKFLEMVPPEAMQITLKLLLRRGYIDEGTIESLKQLKSMNL